MARILVIDESRHRAVDIRTGLIQAGHHPDRNRIAFTRYPGTSWRDESRDAAYAALRKLVMSQSFHGRMKG
jgi:hypothetical protein